MPALKMAVTNMLGSAGSQARPHLPLVLVVSPVEVLLLLGDLLLLSSELLLLVLTLRFFLSRLRLFDGVGCGWLPEGTWGVPCREAPALRACPFTSHTLIHLAGFEAKQNISISCFLIWK